MKALLFEDPFWLYGLLAVTELLLLTSWWRHRDRPHGLRLLVPAALFGLLLLVSTLVVTDREKIQRATQEIVEAVQAGQPDRVAVWLDRDLRATVGSTALNKTQAVARLRAVLARTRITHVEIKRDDIEIKGPDAYQRLLTWIDAKGALGAGRVPVQWKVHWIRTASGWRIYEVDDPRIGVQP